MSDLMIIPRTSEAQWLAERQTRVTATDIGRIANGGPAAKVAVKAEKAGASSFRGNIYTDWGHEREPVLLAHLGFTHDVTANDALYARGDRAATPDGVRYDLGKLDLLGEGKTTVQDWWQGGYKETLEELKRAKQQYLDQIYWAQLVGEVDQTIFTWEPHHNFVPGEIRTLIIPRDDKRIEYLLEVEESFLEFWKGDNQASEWELFMAQYSEAEQALKQAELAVEEMKNDLRKRMGADELSEVTAFGNISLKWSKPTARIDTTALKKAHADIAEKFTKLTAAKQQTLRITTK